MLRISFRTSEATIAAFKSKGSQIVSVLQTKLTAALFLLGAYIQVEKLSKPGPDTLAPRTGKLRGSVRVIPAQIQNTSIRGFVDSSGGPAFYGTYHEHGIPHPWTIVNSKARALRFLTDGKVRFAKSVTHPGLPARRFMENSLEENKTKIFQALQQGVADVLADKE